MSKAFCCDRCGTCFHPRNFKENENYVAMDGWYVLHEQNGKFVYRQDDVHLCPDCARIFCDFMDGKEFVEKKLFDDLMEDYEHETKQNKENDISDSFDAACARLRNKIELLRRTILGDGERDDSSNSDGGSSEREGESKKDGLH